MKHIFIVIFSLLCCASTINAATLINDTEIEKTINNIILPIANAADIPQNRLKIYIINSDEFNAFVQGGEDIFIYTGLLKQIKTPNALRAVIAHELGHTIGGHTIQMADRMHAEMIRNMVIQALGIGLVVAGGNPSAGAGILAGSTGITKQSLLSFSRDEERIADDLAIDLMVKANKTPNGLIEVFEQMQNITGVMETQINPNNINHPLTSERLNNVKRKINTLKKIPTSSTSEEDTQYNMIQAKIIGYLDSKQTIDSRYPLKDTSDTAIYARTISDMRQGNLQQAKQNTLILIKHNPKSPYFYELLGDIEYQYGHYDDSIKAYENSLKLIDKAPQIETALALVLSERKQSDDINKSIELCKKVILSAPSPLAYWILAKVTKDAESDLAMAEFYIMNNDIKTAKKYAKKAKNKASKDSPEYIKAMDIIQK